VYGAWGKTWQKSQSNLCLDTLSTFIFFIENFRSEQHNVQPFLQTFPLMFLPKKTIKPSRTQQEPQMVSDQWDLLLEM
jgi:hypothetical protein